MKLVRYIVIRIPGGAISNMRRLADLESKLPPPTMAAPRVIVRQAEKGQAIEPALSELANRDAFRAGFLAAFGTIDEVVAVALFQQLLNGLHSDPLQPVNSATANLSLALMHSISPEDEIEAMLASQMIVAHVAAMDASRRALHVEQTAGGRQAYLSLARKLMALFTAQMDALNRNRGKTTVQKVIVERVNVAPGAQAIVGAVGGSATKGGGGDR